MRTAQPADERSTVIQALVATALRRAGLGAHRTLAGRLHECPCREIHHATVDWDARETLRAEPGVELVDAGGDRASCSSAVPCAWTRWPFPSARPP